MIDWLVSDGKYGKCPDFFPVMSRLLNAVEVLNCSVFDLVGVNSDGSIEWKADESFIEAALVTRSAQNEATRHSMEAEARKRNLRRGEE